MLRKLPLSLLTSNELAITASRMVDAIDPPLKATFQRRMDKISEAAEQLVIALNKDRSSDYTPRLSEADQHRDNAFLALKYGIMSASYRQDEALKVAGDSLQDILKRHNTTLYDLGYVAQSTEMKSLSAKMTLHQPELEQAGVTKLLFEMNEAMEAFDTLYQEKLAAEGGINLPLVTENRTKLTKQLGLLLSQVEILQEDEEEGMAELVSKFNDIIMDTMNTVRARQTRLENEDKEVEGI